MRRAVLVLAAALAGCSRDEPPPQPPPLAPQTIRCAVIGGMVETGFWPALAERFEDATGHELQLVVSGPKPEVIAAFRRGGIDVLTTHATDAIINVVADGLAVDPRRGSTTTS